ncbi:MAG: hypothetical protein N3D85_01785 [Candidatus Bathyarchaeota archaeon]|nr:hypothetical protein [Candidatus Bathyarchaeota archaeon]
MAEYKAQVQRLLQNAIAQVEQIRNVTLPPVEVEVVTKQWAIDTWGRGYADPDLTSILREEKIYKGLFMIAENESLYQASVDWAGNWGAATWNGKIYVVKENFDPWHLPNAEATFVHELTHIWQPRLPYVTTFDAEKAQASLTEGDASYMGDFFINQTQQTASSTTTVAASQVPLFLLRTPLLKGLQLSLPATISYLNYFPYDYGKNYVSALYTKGGWTAVNQAYKNPPSTTEQILHPEKYFANETAQQIVAPSLTEDTWTQISTDSYGEYFIQVMLAKWLPLEDAKAASSGWGGDKLTYYERGNEYLFTWRIGWDTQYDACEFFVAFNFMMNNTAAVKDRFCYWHINERYLSVGWDQSTNTVLIACSNNQLAAQQSYFT